MHSSPFKKTALKKISLVASTGLILLMSGPVGAVDWINAGTGNWETPSNWSLGSTPLVGDPVIINNGGTAIVTTGGLGAEIKIGASNNGTVIVNGGVLTASWRVAIAYDAGSSGSLIINGGLVTNAADNNFVVGRAGIGRFEMYNDGRLQADYAIIGGDGSGATVAANGDGTTVLNDSSAMSVNKNLSIGMGTGSIGHFTMNGSSTVSVGQALVLGFAQGSVSSLILNDNARVTVQQALYVGYNSTGNLTLNGGVAGSVATFYVGYNGTGNLTINGGTASAGTALYLGRQVGANGTVLVNQNGTLTAQTYGYVGYAGTGSLTIDGGRAQFGNQLILGFNAGSSGTLTVSNNGQVETGTVLYIGAFGAGTVVVTSGGSLKATTGISIAFDAGSQGVLAVGAVGTNVAAAPGIVDTPEIVFESGNGALVFNHTNNGGYNFTPVVSGAGRVEVYSGKTVMMGASTYTGATTIYGGSLAAGAVNVFSATSDYDVRSGGTLDLQGYDQTIPNLVNAGTVQTGRTPGTTLTVAGTYIGNGGSLGLSSTLGDDTSLTDRLIVNGDVSGNTNLHILNVGGQGAATVRGIPIIFVEGNSPATAFSLAGDYVTETGQQAVIGGAYAYTLHQDTTDGHWYLSSAMKPVPPTPPPSTPTPPPAQPETPLLRYQPGDVVFEQYPQVLQSLNTVSTLQQRVGDLFRASDIGKVGTTRNLGLWGRFDGARMASDPAQSTSLAKRDIDVLKLQTGLDFVLKQNADGSLLVGGLNVSYGQANAEMKSVFGRGKIDTTGYGIGATLTWYGQTGFYVDGQAQAMLFDSDLTSTTIGRKLVSGNNGHGYVLSVEAGKKINLSNGYSLTPQAQLIWSRVDFSNFNDPYGAVVSLHDGDSLRGRIGVSLDKHLAWTASDGTQSKAHFYGIANLYNEFLNGSNVMVSGVPFRTRDERLWGGLGLGGTYDWNNGLYSLYGDINMSASFSGMSDTYAWGGSVGFRARW